MGFGLIAAALSGAGNSAANSAGEFQKYNDAQAIEMRKAEIEKTMLQHRADVNTEMSNRIADHTNKLANAPFERARAIMAEIDGQAPADVDRPSTPPTPVSPSARLTPASGNVDINHMTPEQSKDFMARAAAQFGLQPDPARPGSSIVGGIPGATAPGADPVAPTGKLRERTQQQRLSAGYDAAIEKGDLQAASLIKASIPEKWTAIPDGGSLRNSITGEVITPGMSKADRQDLRDDRADARLEKRLEAAAKERDKSQEFRAGESQKTRDAVKDRAMPPSDITDLEKSNWIHTYITNGGGVPRSAPAFVRNSIGTWAAQAGITPDDIAKGTAQAKFDLSASVTSGHRAGTMAGVEAAMPALVENAVSMSAKINRTSFVPLNKLMMMGEDMITDPDMAAFRVAHQALASEYQQVIGRGGANVFALKEAMHVLEAARNQDAYVAAANQVNKEVQINVDAMNAVRANAGGAHGGTHAAPAKVGGAKPSLDSIFGK